MTTFKQGWGSLGFDTQRTHYAIAAVECFLETNNRFHLVNSTQQYVHVNYYDFEYLVTYILIKIAPILQNSDSKSLKATMLLAHIPAQYQKPLYRLLQSHGVISLKSFFCDYFTIQTNQLRF